jgi:hypothetical protein
MAKSKTAPKPKPKKPKGDPTDFPFGANLIKQKSRRRGSSGYGGS